ncbi:unnamed protein product [Pleuronectes platessa]|uniref:Uncharacterized protein n=1 Tax=Pleuronectes platessa TaxID=8262 RepID=A0A9N7TVE7_PLEPL|nr:unnamed protein product [Pleuronectes platessa]
MSSWQQQHQQAGGGPRHSDIIQTLPPGDMEVTQQPDLSQVHDFRSRAFIMRSSSTDSCGSSLDEDGTSVRLKRAHGAPFPAAPLRAHRCSPGAAQVQIQLGSV